MTGKPKMFRKNHLACYHQSPLSKGLHLLFSASYVEYVRTISIQLSPPFYHQSVANTTFVANSQLVGHCLSMVTDKPHQDPRQVMQSLDAWRKSLAAKLHVGGDTGTSVYYLNIQAMSYRFECILCRLIRRRWQKSQHADWSEWAKQRLRSAILELDTIAMRVLASGTLHNFPMSL